MATKVNDSLKDLAGLNCDPVQVVEKHFPKETSKALLSRFKDNISDFFMLDEGVAESTIHFS